MWKHLLDFEKLTVLYNHNIAVLEDIFKYSTASA